MAGPDTHFLKDEHGLGPVLARGLAETVCASPEDPVQFLGMWLKHYLQEKEHAAQERVLEKELKDQREEWLKKRLVKERAASEAIQQGWKHRQERSKEEAEKETALLARIGEAGEELEADGSPYDPESIGLENILDKEAKQQDQEDEVAMLQAECTFNKWNAYVRILTKENIASIKSRQQVSPEIVKIMRCVFYLLGKLPSKTASGDKMEATPKKLQSWKAIRDNIKPYPFIIGVQELDPCIKRGEEGKQTDPPTKRRINRVRRILDGLERAGIAEETIKKDPSEGGGGIAVWLLWKWLRAAVDWRTSRDDVFSAKKADGKGPFGEAPTGKNAGDPTGGLAMLEGWEADPGEEDEAEEKDADEEAQKQVEEEERKAKAAEEAEEGGGEAEGEEDQ